MKIRHLQFIVPMIAFAVLAGCQPDDTPETADATAEPVAKSDTDTPAATKTSHVVEVIARDFSFEAPEQLPSGWTTFRFVNEGEQEHFMALTRMPEGLTVDDYLNDVVHGAFGGAMAPYYEGEVELATALENLVAMIPEWYAEVTPSGGAGLLSGGMVSETTVELEPGYYVMECYVKAPDGRFHVDMGMLRGLTVTEAASGAATPEGTVEVTLANYVIDAPDRLDAGKHTVKVRYLENPDGFFMHDVHLARMTDDVSIEDVIPWMSWIDGMVSPAPVEFLGGADQMPAGNTAYLEVDLEPGAYAWISEGYAAQGAVKGFVVE
jgi:hypothetical protein